MNDRPKQTLMDYMVVGISPALIMLMVGSLMFFLINVFYQGQYEGRLSFIVALFVMAIVCVARIAMEEGIEYATMFAIPLALVTMLAMARFVQFQGPLAGASMIINLGLIALVWWSAHQLTWDCTLVDETQDSSGEGLLQHVGMDGETVEEQASQQRNELEPARRSSQAKKIDDPSVAPQWWRRVLDRKRRPHTPGVWVLYYALAALPLFAAGEWFISDPVSRESAFHNLVVYVGSALGLLLTTSFLGLRRYLRQRNLEMPLDMAGLWLGIGTITIFGLLIFSVFLPRPGATQSVSQLPFSAGSPQHQRTHQHALGNDGPERPTEATRTRSDAKKSGKNAPAERNGKGDPGEAQKNGSSPDAKSSQQQGSSKSRSQQSGSQRSQSNQQSSTDNQSSQQESRPGRQSEQGDNRQSGQSQRNERSGEDSASGDQGADRDNARDDSGGQKQGSEVDVNAKRRDSGQDDNKRSEPSGSAEQQQDRQQRQDNRPNDNRQTFSNKSNKSNKQGGWSQLVSGAAKSLGGLLKLVFWAVLICVVLYFAWKYREQLVAAIRQLIDDLRNLWARLFGGGRREDATQDADEIGKAVKPSRPFASYQDPFVSGRATKHSTEQLVRYTFEALEAWAQERECAREDDQTPLEFARDVAAQHPQLGVSAQQLADLYSRVAYGHEQIARERRTVLEQVWRKMTAAAAVPAVR